MTREENSRLLTSEMAWESGLSMKDFRNDRRRALPGRSSRQEWLLFL